MVAKWGLCKRGVKVWNNRGVDWIRLGGGRAARPSPPEPPILQVMRGSAPQTPLRIPRNKGIPLFPGRPEADFLEAFRPTGNGGSGGADAPPEKLEIRLQMHKSKTTVLPTLLEFCSFK